jgi:hypothetical protein
MGEEEEMAEELIGIMAVAGGVALERVMCWRRRTVMNTRPREHANHDFLIGLVTGSVIGAGLAILFAPQRPSKFLHQVTGAAADLGNAASRRYQDVTARVAAMASNTGHPSGHRVRRTSRGKIQLHKK